MKRVRNWLLVLLALDGGVAPDFVVGAEQRSEVRIAGSDSTGNPNPKDHAKKSAASDPVYRSLPATKLPTSRDAIGLPKYRDGEIVKLRVRDRFCFLIKPTVRIDPQRRWVWDFPFELALNDSNGYAQHRFYIEKLLAAGFHVAGIDVGVSCGSPKGAEVCEEFYRYLIEKEGLNRRARLLGQSNGGLIAYAWAFRHPTSVDRIAGIYPATDVRLWPGLTNVLLFPTKGLDYGLTPEQLAAQLPDLNPIDNLAPLAKAGVKLFHIHGDKDKLVPLEGNSAELVRRYTKLEGSAELVVVNGLGHGGKAFYESQKLIAFLLSD